MIQARRKELKPHPDMEGTHWIKPEDENDEIVAVKLRSMVLTNLNNRNFKGIMKISIIVKFQEALRDN
jgi:hypothetical protein